MNKTTRLYGVEHFWKHGDNVNTQLNKSFNIGPVLFRYFNSENAAYYTFTHTDTRILYYCTNTHTHINSQSVLLPDCCESVS